jgi:hypothetical protein
MGLEKNMVNFQNYTKLSWIVLIFSSSIIVVTLIPTLFPALYSVTFTETYIDKIGGTDNVLNEPFELGFFFISVMLTNIIVFAIILILKFKKIFTFPHYNISKRNAIFVMFALLVIFSGLSYDKMTSKDEHRDWEKTKENLDLWGLDSLTNLSFELHVRKFLLNSSFWIFGNYSIIPFLSSVALLVVVYLFTNKITDNRLAGIIAVSFMLQSNLFLSFSSIPTYTIFWVLFYLISTYTIIQKNWFISPISYVLAILSKPLVVMFLPLTIFFVLNSEIKKKNKLGIIGITLSIVIVGAYVAAGDDPSMYEGMKWDEFMIGFTSFSYQMRFDWIIVIFILPITIGLFLISKNNNYANSISIMNSGILLTTPLLVGLTDITSQPYRFIPLIVFLAIAVGMIIGNKNRKSKKQKKETN